MLGTVINDKWCFRMSQAKKSSGRPRINLSETMVRYAISQTYSAAEAARYLNVSYNTFKYYAKQYIDEESGKSLFDLHKKKVRPPGIKDDRSYHCNKGYKEKLEDILAGKHPGYNSKTLRKRLLLSGWVECVCESCGWDEPRITDGNYPLLINFRDSNWRNCHMDNIQLLCFNCYFNQVRSPATSWQGWSYGTAGKQRWDGKPKGYGSKKWNEEHGINTTYRERRADQLAEMAEEYEREHGIKPDWGSTQSGSNDV